MIKPERAAAQVIVLFGPPGSGKSTQARVLKDSLNLPLISPGEMLREHMAIGDSIGHAITKLMDSGSLVPDHIVTGIVWQRIENPDCERGFILDGYPRTLDQARSLVARLSAPAVDAVIVQFIVQADIIVSRLSGRRCCPKCGAVYHITSSPPLLEGVCDHDQAKLTIRRDDHADVIRERLLQYERLTNTAIAFLREAGYPFNSVTCSEDPPEIIAGSVQRYLRRFF